MVSLGFFVLSHPLVSSSETPVTHMLDYLIAIDCYFFLPLFFSTVLNVWIIPVDLSSSSLIISSMVVFSLKRNLWKEFFISDIVGFCLVHARVHVKSLQSYPLC